MDTGSHLIFGVTLAGLSHLDPVINQTGLLADAVMITTLIGSHAPDFDTVTRIKGYSYYLKNHRGISHSIPALFFWPLLFSLPIAFIYQIIEYWDKLYLWGFIAVVFHVFLDLLNTYGVQSGRPYTKKWFHLDVLSLFEPFLFGLHVIGIILWRFFHYNPQILFIYVYLITLMHIGLKVLLHIYLLKLLEKHFNTKYKIAGNYHVFPTFNLFHWRFVIEAEKNFYTGKIKYKKIIFEDIYPKKQKNSIIEATIKTDGVRIFLQFAQKIHVSWKELHDGYEVKWSDVRFWYNHKLPFGVDIKLDKDLNVIKHHLGWRKKAWDPPFE